MAITPVTQCPVTAPSGIAKYALQARDRSDLRFRADEKRIRAKSGIFDKPRSASADAC